MDIISIAMKNAHIDACAKAKAGQTKAKRTDKTCRERAKLANIRDAVERPSAWRSVTDKHVRFGAMDPAKLGLRAPRRGILKK